jgi:hypothetical protein
MILDAIYNSVISTYRLGTVCIFDSYPTWYKLDSMDHLHGDRRSTGHIARHVHSVALSQQAAWN